MVLEKIGAAPGSGYGAFPGQTFNPATGQVITYKKLAATPLAYDGI